MATRVMVSCRQPPARRGCVLRAGDEEVMSTARQGTSKHRQHAVIALTARCSAAVRVLGWWGDVEVAAMAVMAGGGVSSGAEGERFVLSCRSDRAAFTSLRLPRFRPIAALSSQPSSLSSLSSAHWSMVVRAGLLCGCRVSTHSGSAVVFTAASLSHPLRLPTLTTPTVATLSVRALYRLRTSSDHDRSSQSKRLPHSKRLLLSSYLPPPATLIPSSSFGSACGSASPSPRRLSPPLRSPPSA